MDARLGENDHREARLCTGWRVKGEVSRAASVKALRCVESCFVIRSSTALRLRLPLPAAVHSRRLTTAGPGRALSLGVRSLRRRPSSGERYECSYQRRRASKSSTLARRTNSRIARCDRIRSRSSETSDWMSADCDVILRSRMRLVSSLAERRTLTDLVLAMASSV
jgi:hypothetical protein